MATVTVTECHPNGVVGDGSFDAEVLLCGIAPGRDEAMRSHRPFTGPSGKLLDATLKATGWHRDKCFATNLLCWWNNAPTEDEIRDCLPRLQSEISRVKPKLIIALGRIASEFLTKQKFGKVRGVGIWSDDFDCWILSTYHPSVVLRQHGNPFISDIVRDLKKIPLILNWSRNESRVDWTLIESRSDAQHILDTLPYEDFVALDVETIYETGELRCLAISSYTGTWVFPRYVLDNLKWPTARWTFHNGMFDTEVLRKNLGIDLPIVEDTLLMSYSLDERGGGQDEGPQDRAVGIHGLKRLSAEYLGVGFYDIDTRTVDDGLQLYAYNAKDAAYTYRLAQWFSEWQSEDNVREMYKELLIKPANVLTRVHERGAYVNTGELKTVGLEWAKRWIAEERVLVTFAQTLGWQGEINLNSPMQLKRLFFEILGLPETQYGRSTQKRALDDLNHPFAQRLRKWRGLDHMLSTYVIGIEDDIDTDRYCHPSAMLHGTRTGRWTYRRPPVQTMPTDYKSEVEYGSVRRFFAAPSDDREVLQADYKQSELYAAVMCSGDPVMLADLQSGDFHQMATEDMFQVRKVDCKPLEWERYRHDSKFVSFGILFGRQAPALAKAELKAYSVSECRRFVNRWLKRYSVYTEWAESEKRAVQETGEQVNKAGRKRRYHLVLDRKVLNQAVNFPIQSLSHDNLVLSMTELYESLLKLNSFILFEVHDSLILDIDKQRRNEVVSLVKEVMEQNRFGVGVPVEIKVGPSWGEVKAIDTKSASTNERRN